MNRFVSIITITVLTSIVNGDVCTDRICACSQSSTIVNCDGKGWANLIEDRLKIENLSSLTDLILNQNPLGIIPLFNNSKIRSLSLQDTSLISIEFPSSYIGSFLKTISLSNNKIHIINENDFINLKNSKVKKLHIDDASLSSIHQNAFTPLIQLQSLSLKNNQLKSCEFLSTFSLLSSIKFDGNKFLSLPQQLSSDKTIKTYSFTNNLISIIDESSPLYTWFKMGYTNNKIYLANNTFDCCQSLWFIRFLKSNLSSRFVDDASLLTCTTPLNFAGKQLIKLNPDEMDCGGILPNKSWWTIGRIIGVVVGGSIAIIALIVVIIIVTRQKQSRSGYTEIDGVDDPLPTAPSLSSSQLVYPVFGQDDDTYSTYSTANSTRNTTRSEAPTYSTASGITVIDGNQN